MFASFKKSLSSFLIFILLLTSGVPAAAAQQPVTPTVYCVGGVGAPPCAPIESASPSVSPSASVSPSLTQTTSVPISNTIPSSSPAPTVEPCESQNSIQQHGGWKKKKKKKFKGNTRGGFFEQFIEFLRKFIEYLIGGGQMPTLPDPGTQPDPCDQEPEPTDAPEPSDNPEPSEPDEPSNNPTTGQQPTISVSATTNPQPTTAAAAGCTQADIQKLVDSVSQANIEANLKKLVQDDSKPTPNETVSRHVTGAGNPVKVAWAKEMYTSYGLTVVPMPFSADGQQLDNAIGRLTGSDPNSFYATGGHIDSQSEDAENVAPGADDDGSGTVAAMEAARVLKGFQKCLKSSIDFIGFNDEEESMEGSSTYIDQMQGKTFKGLLNMDMIGTGRSACVVNYYNSSKDKPLSDKLAEVNTKYNIGLDFAQDTYSTHDVDAANFWQAGMPSAHAAECQFSSVYHNTKDQTQYVNFDQITKMTKIIVAGLAELASQ